MDYKNLTPEMIQAYDDFLDLVDIASFRVKLRDLLLHYISEEYEELPYGYGQFVEDMMFLLRLMDD